MSLKDKTNKIITNKKQYILNIGNNGVVLTYVVGNTPKNAWLAKGDPQKAIKTLEKGFSADKTAPIAILIDTPEQDYKITNIPNVSILEKGKIVKRQLQMSFQDEGLRAHTSLKNKNENSSEYLFVNILKSEHILSWVEEIKKLDNPYAGTYLLPLECASLIDEILDEPSKGWKIFAGKSAVGSYRFIVTRNGRTVFSRMTSVQDTDSDAMRVDTIKRDLASTLAYVRRIGLAANEKINLAIITSPNVAKEINPEEFDFAKKIEVLTLPEVAKKLNLGKIGKESPPFCDMLHATWFALGKTKKIRIKTGKTDINDIKSIIVMYRKPISVILLGLFLLLSFSKASDISELKENISIKESQISRLNKNISKLKKEESGLLYDVDEMKNTLKYADVMNSDFTFSFEAISNKIFDVFNKHKKDFQNVIITNINIIPKTQTIQVTRRKTEIKQTHELEIEVMLPDDIYSSKDALEFSQTILSNFENEFKNSTIKMTKLPASSMSNNVLSGSSNMSNTRTEGSPRYKASFSFYPENSNAYEISNSEKEGDK
jgi:hypothetical protein